MFKMNILMERIITFNGSFLNVSTKFCIIVLHVGGPCKKWVYETHQLFFSRNTMLRNKFRKAFNIAIQRKMLCSKKCWWIPNAILCSCSVPHVYILAYPVWLGRRDAHRVVGITHGVLSTHRIHMNCSNLVVFCSLQNTVRTMVS